MTDIMPRDEVQKLLDNIVGITPDALPLMKQLLASVIAAHDEIDRLRAEVERVQSDRHYVIGANDGWDAAVEQGEASPAVGKAMVRFWKKLAETHNARADNLAADNTRLAAQVEALTRALSVCDRVLHFDLQKMIVFGDDYNQAVKDAADATRAALEAAEIATWPKHMQDTFRAVMGQRKNLQNLAKNQGK